MEDWCKRKAEMTEEKLEEIEEEGSQMRANKTMSMEGEGAMVGRRA